jgi:hypothetical protein
MAKAFTPKNRQSPPRNEEKATEEARKPSVSKPGGFKNDPDDPTNPNEAIERSRRKLRP